MESSGKIQEVSCAISYEPKLNNENEVQVTSEKTFDDDITKILNKISELKQDEGELQEKMLNDILTEEKVLQVHYEEILRNNQANIKSLINNINIIFDNKNVMIEFEEVSPTNYKQFLKIIHNTVQTDVEEYDKLYGDKKEYDFISYEIDNLPEGFQSMDYLDIEENKILNIGKINFEEKNDPNNKPKISNRKEELLEKIQYKNSSKNRKEIIKELVMKNCDIIWLERDELGTCNVEKHEINLTDNKPVYVKQFPLPHKLKEIAVEEIPKN